jgi:hypothetical protein
LLCCPVSGGIIERPLPALFRRKGCTALCSEINARRWHLIGEPHTVFRSIEDMHFGKSLDPVHRMITACGVLEASDWLR